MIATAKSKRSGIRRELDEFTAQESSRIERRIREMRRKLLVTQVKRALIFPLVCLRSSWAVERWEITYPDICGHARYGIEEYGQNLWKLHRPKPGPLWQRDMRDVRAQLHEDPRDKDALEKLAQLNASDELPHDWLE